MSDVLRAVIVDDSSIYRSILTRVLKQIPDVELVGTANNGRRGIEVVEEQRPDLVLLDVEMPEMDGLAALKVIATRFSDVSVLMVSGVSDSRRTLQALSLGAIDFIVKPENDGKDALRKQLRKGVRVVQAQRRRRGSPSPVARPVAASSSTPVTPTRVSRVAAAVGSSRLILVGISTGGPRALEALLSPLPGDLGCPMLIVQHMPAGFTESLAQSLNAKSRLDIAEAKEGDLVSPGRVLIAPGGKHMEVVSSPTGDRSLVVHLHDGAPRNECKPSVDVLFDSVRTHFRGEILAAIMTGMGNDGCQSVGEIKGNGHYCIAQDEASCVVYGMPRAVVEAGYADDVLSLGAIAPRMEEWMSGSVSEGGP